MRKHQIVFVLVYSDKLYIYFHLLSYDYDALLEKAVQRKEFVHMFRYVRICVYPSISLRGNFEALMTRNGVPLEYFMVFEALRLKSFFGVDIAVSRIELAKAGFYATGHGDETRCFSCGVRYKNWRQGERPHDVIHKHDCRHSHGSHRGNVPFAENTLPLTTDITSSRQWYPTSDYDLHDPQAKIHPPYTPPQNGRPSSQFPPAPGSTTGRDYHTPDYNQENVRLASFRSWPRERGPTPQQLAAAGFYYTGFSDKVRCYRCGVCLRKWDEEDDPRQEHARFKPNCRFLAERCPADTTPQDTVSSPKEIKSQRATAERDKESRDKKESNTCKICLEDPVNIVFLPCGHLVACDMCAPALERCPVCRKHIRGTVRVRETGNNDDDQTPYTYKYIYIRCIYVILPKIKYVFKLKYGNIIAKKAGGEHLTDIFVNITCLANRSCYFSKSLKNAAFSMFYMPERKAPQHTSILVYTNPSISLNGNFEALVSRRGATLQEVMVYEALRVRSYHGVDTANVSTIRLAAAGFYATEHSGQIRCFSCGVRQRIGPQATERHQTECRHRNGLPCGNVTFADCPLASEWNIVRNLPRYPTTDIDLHQPRMQLSATQLHRNVANNAYEPRQADHAVPHYPIAASPAALEVKFREGHQAPQRPPGEVPKGEDTVCSTGIDESRELDEDQDRLFRDICRGDSFPVGDRSDTFTSLQVTQQSTTAEASGNMFSGHGLERWQLMESSLCRICLENPASVHFHSCGHLVLRTLCTCSERCPVCRQHLT